MKEEIYLDDEKYDRDREMEMDAPITDEVVDNMKDILKHPIFNSNPFSLQMEATIAELDNAYERLVLFPETQIRVRGLKAELQDLINSKSL